MGLSAVGHEAGAAAEATAAVGVHLVHDGGGLLGGDQESCPATGRAQRHRRRQTQGSPLALRQLARVLPTLYFCTPVRPHYFTITSLST